jgi:hypothetical protein
MRRSTLYRWAVARVRPALTAPLPLLGLLVAAGPLVLSAGSVGPPVEHPAELAYHDLPALPEGSSAAGEAGVVASAVALAVSLDAVPMDALGTECPTDELTVLWVEPEAGEFSVGAHSTPIGPAPIGGTTSVNGIVVCGDLTYAYMGFEARYVGGRWDVVDTPFVDEGHEELVVQPAPEIPAGPKPVPVLAAPGTVTGPIEGYAAYEPQRTCDPSAKVGMRSLAGALLRDYAGSRNLGIVRGCSVGGRSEHKEGRAFDWGVNITNPNEKAAAGGFIGALMATDADGNRHALARRMGVMYVIWDRQIWSSYRASEGWRPYTGSSPHRDHVHISMSWAGATGRTSFWSGTVPPDLPTASPNTSTVASRRSSSSSTASRSSSGRRSWGGDNDNNDDDGDRGGSRGVRLSREQLTAGVAALWHGDVPPTAAEIQAWLVSQGVSEGWAQQYAGWAADRAARQAARDDDSGDDDGDHDDDGDERREEWERERADRDARREADREAREEREAEEREEREQREAEEEARRDREREEREQREAEEEAERESRQNDGDGDRGRGGRRGRRGGETTTTTAPTTTTTAPTTTTVAPTTTTAAPTTTTAAPPPPDPTTTTSTP